MKLLVNVVKNHVLGLEENFMLAPFGVSVLDIFKEA